MADTNRRSDSQPAAMRRPHRPVAGAPGVMSGAAPSPPEAGPGAAPDVGESLVLLEFKGRRKSYYHNRRGVALKVGDHCLVEADRGTDLGRVTYVGPGRPEWWAVAQRQGVLAPAAADDLRRQQEWRAEEAKYREICRDRIRKRSLDMDLVTVERQHDGRKITFFFTADGRVDFRELVRDLAAVFRTRIELRQIGVRDDARLRGGLATCGREYCCSGFLHEFVPVTLKMAKTQQLPLNPAKLSGPCGRLRCCLAFENEQYRASSRRLPRVGMLVQTPDGPATVRQTDLLAETVTVDGREPGSRVAWPAGSLRWDDPAGGGDRSPPGDGRGHCSRGGCPGCSGGGA